MIWNGCPSRCGDPNFTQINHTRLASCHWFIWKPSHSSSGDGIVLMFSNSAAVHFRWDTLAVIVIQPQNLSQDMLSFLILLRLEQYSSSDFLLRFQNSALLLQMGQNFALRKRPKIRFLAVMSVYTITEAEFLKRFRILTVLISKSHNQGIFLSFKCAQFQISVL